MCDRQPVGRGTATVLNCCSYRGAVVVRDVKWVGVESCCSVSGSSVSVSGTSFWEGGRRMRRELRREAAGRLKLRLRPIVTWSVTVKLSPCFGQVEC